MTAPGLRPRSARRAALALAAGALALQLLVVPVAAADVGSPSPSPSPTATATATTVCRVWDFESGSLGAGMVAAPAAQVTVVASAPQLGHGTTVTPFAGSRFAYLLAGSSPSNASAELSLDFYANVNTTTPTTALSFAVLFDTLDTVDSAAVFEVALEAGPGGGGGGGTTRVLLSLNASDAASGLTTQSGWLARSFTFSNALGLRRLTFGVYNAPPADRLVSALAVDDVRLCFEGSPSPSPTATASTTASSTASPTGTASVTPSPSGTGSQSGTGTPSASQTGTPSHSQTGTGSASQTQTGSASGTGSASQTASMTATMTATASGTRTSTGTPSQTATPSSSATGTPSASGTGSMTPSMTATSSMTPTQTGAQGCGGRRAGRRVVR
jgi:hypothetical protein